MTNWKQSLRDRQLASIIQGRWQRPERSGSVYIIKIGGIYKIGRSVNPELRIKAMQLPNAPDDVKVFKLKLHSDSMELEAALHKRFADKREYGEWFSLTTDEYLDAQEQCSKWAER